MDKINYYLYHIPGKKIGVTRDLISRVVDQQGYSLDEVEVLEQSTDIDYISDRELELQQSYGYRVDRQKYKDLYINKIKSNTMHINATEQTSTFPCPESKLKGRLMDNMGKTWETTHGTFEINMDTIKWIMDNVTTSQYTMERCYIYNKAFAKYFQVKDHATEAEMFPFGKDAYQAYFLVLNDTYVKRGSETDCGVNCTMHQFFIETEIDQEVLISAHTWDIKQYMLGCSEHAPEKNILWVPSEAYAFYFNQGSVQLPSI